MEKILMGSIVSFALFTFISYLLIILHIPYLIIPIVILAILLVLKPVRKILSEVKIEFNLQTLLVFVVFSIGIIGQMLIISPSGIFKNGDLLFWSSNGHDASWHIALMDEIKRGYPLQNPSFAEGKLVNYHFFSDIAPAMISKYLPISDLDLYFRIFPFIYSLFLGASVYFLTKRITNNFLASIWAVIFTYFAGSFGFIVTYLKNKTIGGESIFWATQIQSSNGNPPQIISDFLMITALYFLLIYLQRKNNNKLVFAICVLLFGTVSAFKIYAGIVLLGALGVIAVLQFLKERKTGLIFLTAISGIIAAFLYFPNSSGSTSFLIFQPWWYIRTMIVESSRLNLLDWELRRQTYLSVGRFTSYLRVIQLEGTAFLIFIFGNLGMRFFGFWDMIKMIKDSPKKYFNMIFILIILISVVLPLLFLQKGVASNTSQFLQYFILLFGILAGITTARLASKFKFIIPIILIVMIPTQVGLLYDFYGTPQKPRAAFAQVSKSELEALNFVKYNSPVDSVIVTPPYNQYLNIGGGIPNMWDWFDTSYVAAFSERHTYFDDYEQADIMGYDYKPRLEIKETIFESIKADDVRTALLKTKANLIYFPKTTPPKIKLETISLTKYFENQDVQIWRIN